MSLCKLSDANGYNVKETIYTEEKLRFEDSCRFKDCVKTCMDNYTCRYVKDCMNYQDCAICVDVCYEEHNPNLFLIDLVFNDIDEEACFINNL